MPGLFIDCETSKQLAGFDPHWADVDLKGNLSSCVFVVANSGPRSEAAAGTERILKLYWAKHSTVQCFDKVDHSGPRINIYFYLLKQHT